MVARGLWFLRLHQTIVFQGFSHGFNLFPLLFYGFYKEYCKGIVLLLHHLVRIGLPVLQCDTHRVCSGGQLAHVDAFEGLALRAHQAALQVEEVDLLGLNVGGKL